MIKKLMLIAIAVVFSAALPTLDKAQLSKKIVAIIPAETENLKPAETFYSGYNTGYPSLGWRGDQKPVGGPIYGSYPTLVSYGSYIPGPVVVDSRPTFSHGGYGWRQGVNPWAV